MSNKLQPVAEDQIYNDTDVNYNSLSPAEKRKLQKEERILQKKKDKWKIYLDFLLRHITIVTSKYINWEKNEFELFKVRNIYFIFCMINLTFKMLNFEIFNILLCLKTFWSL